MAATRSVQDAVHGLLDAGFELEEIDAAVDLLVALPNLIQPEGDCAVSLTLIPRRCGF